MFSKILIANRGEIACRIIKTARKMGIATVAVYSDADRDAEHVKMADEAIHIGPSSTAQSYLDAEKIIAACKKSGAEAVHPGYGFLSERASFCEALEKSGIIFIGPKAKSIAAMGDKITSKKIAAEAGVSTVPGVLDEIKDAEHAVKISKSIGYPVMMKASAGGGGKGMRIAWKDAEVHDGFARSQSEAASSFGDDRMFIEKFIEDPRHIEIQLLGDAHGTLLYLGERECSVQRRNQKVVEEAPSPFIDEATRRAMGEQSVALAKAVDYQSAGTVEFIVDKNRNFYFLEMNTRLQVEHPVTELVTGIDIVEQMIRVAAGEKLGLSQGDIKLNGWAIESRLYAEDPYRNFLPSIGRLTRYRPPPESQTIRNDTGVTEGSEISIFYDPMIAKLCTWAPTRIAAIDAMVDALDQFEIEGIGHNLPFCAALMQHPRWRDGRLSTAFIAEEFPDGFHAPHPDEKAAQRFAVAAALLSHLKETRLNKLKATSNDAKIIRLAGREFEVSVNRNNSVTVNGSSLGVVQTTWTAVQKTIAIEFDGHLHTIKLERTPKGYRLRQRGMDVDVEVFSPRVAELAVLMPVKKPRDTSNFLLCPMPGLVIALNVKAGDDVHQGQILAIVEAMKMENILRAEKSGRIARLATAVGQNLAVDDIILEFET
jgi:propionyl-CoA carboxylase alpha chain